MSPKIAVGSYRVVLGPRGRGRPRRSDNMFDAATQEFIHSLIAPMLLLESELAALGLNWDDDPAAFEQLKVLILTMLRARKPKGRARLPKNEREVMALQTRRFIANFLSILANPARAAPRSMLESRMLLKGLGVHLVPRLPTRSADHAHK